MPLSVWKPTDKTQPAPDHVGGLDRNDIHLAAGLALNQWEHLEMGLMNLFQVLCESPSFAPCRAYGTLESSYPRALMLNAATEVFFGRRSEQNSAYHLQIKAAIAAYQVCQQYRNNIAHGVVIGFHNIPEGGSGYFLVPPSYATKKVSRINPQEIYVFGANYWYNSADLDHYRTRFAEILQEVRSLTDEVNKKYSVLTKEQLHR